MAGGRCGNFCLDFYVTLDGKGNLSSFLKAGWHERCSFRFKFIFNFGFANRITFQHYPEIA
jgi:hypothetical protein